MQLPVPLTFTLENGDSIAKIRWALGCILGYVPDNFGEEVVVLGKVREV